MKRTLFLILLMWLLPHSVLMAQDVKAISFNIRYNGSAKEDGNNAWLYRSNAVVNMIKREEPVVMGVQEALLDQLSYIDRRIYKQYRRVGVGRDNGISRGEFVAIYYDFHKLDLISHTTRWLSEHPTKTSKGWDAACMRTVTIALFRVKESGKMFYYFNTHLDHVGEKARRESMILIAKLIQEMVKGDIPVIVGGDMNSSIDSHIFNPLFNIGFDNARELAPRTDYKNTYNAFGKAKGSIIDHFFVLDAQVKRFQTLTRDYGAPYISDHYPISIILSL